MRMKVQPVLAVLAAAALLTAADPAQAYLGPGLGLGAIGVAFGVISSIVLGLFAIIWYPVKRLARAIRRKLRRDEAGVDGGVDGGVEDRTEG